MAEGEKDKVIQSAKKSVEQKDKDVSTHAPEKDKVHDQPSNSVPFPSTPETPDEPIVEIHPENDSDYYG